LNVEQIAQLLKMKIISGDKSKIVTGIYVCDLLSWVISHAKDGDLWITVIANINVIAVASLTDVACIVISEDVTVEQDIITRANEKGITLLTSDLASADIVIKVNELLEASKNK